ncbi:MAG: MBL fold metallo-hydrolase [Lewinellaceae bacterium]|nr:MBL fold metallo-hydrolase [Phaeodactylibacter sp.]MCB9039620.1 MBL fold metallo-hydrolase [Lewinellaceae bacterium]
MQEILKNIHLIKLGAVNAYLIDHGGLTLIDTGYPGSEKKIFGYLNKIGRRPEQIEQVIVTHLHTDHSGSLAAIQAATGTRVLMHPADAAMVMEGRSFREQVEIAPGFVNKIVYNLMIKNVPRTIEPVKADAFLEDGQVLPVGEGLKVIHAPGHAEGQVALLYQDPASILFAADTCGSMMGLALAPFYENLQQGRESLGRLGAIEFEAATFGHGKPIMKDAAHRFRKKFGSLVETA